MPHNASYKFILLSDFMYFMHKEEGIFNNYLVDRYDEKQVYGAISVYSGQLGDLFSSLRSPIPTPLPALPPTSGRHGTPPSFYIVPHGL
jgi:hypothetical protein